jgi:pentatricopeptide repeat protein
MKYSCSTSNAVKAFRRTASPNVISWTSLIAGFTENGLEEESFQLFAEMRAAGVQPNSFTLSTILGACNKMRSVALTMMLHGHIRKTKTASDRSHSQVLIPLRVRRYRKVLFLHKGSYLFPLKQLQ